MAEHPHFSLPFRWAPAAGGGLAAAETEQESSAEITDCVIAIVRTTQGQRTSLPDFGRPELEFNTSPELTKAAITDAVSAWEPRAVALADAAPDPTDVEAQLIRAYISPADNEEGDTV